LSESSAASEPPELREIRRRTVDLYDAVTLLMLFGIAVLVVYSIELGPLTSPGAQQSFGLALSLMFLMGAVLFHIVDRTYRVWPLGRRITPTAPAPVTDAAVARLFRVLVVIAAGGAISYLITTGLLL
jgi:hypothetical protein